MCGIVGVIQYKSEVPREIRHRALRILFSETMLKTEPRGKDATGLYQVHSDGDWMMTKKGQKVTDWVHVKRDDKLEDPIVYSEIVDTWIEHPQELKAVAGHCRAATVGSKGKDNNDNHPFAVQLDEHNAILGIHNGTLNNHEIIFERLPKMLPRHGNVDSEAIFHFLYHLTEKGTKPVDPDMLKYLGRRLEGTYAVIMMNSRFPDQVVTFRKDRPMEYYMIAPLNIVVIASERKFVESALEKYEFMRTLAPEYAELPKLEHHDRMLAERDYRIFDASLDWPKGKPIHADLDKISDQGVMTKTVNDFEEDWKGPEKTTTTYSSGYSSGTGSSWKGNSSKGSTGSTSKGSTGSTGGVKTTKKSDSVTASQSKTGDKDDDAGVLVEVEIGSEAEAKKGMEQAKALGVMVCYDTPKEIATSLGIKEDELEKMGGVDLANTMAALHFNIGYGAARLHSKNEIDEVRKKGKAQTDKMERLADKQKKAQNHIWEFRQLITIMLALNRGGYKLTPENVAISLAAFPDLNKARRQDIERAAKALFEAKDTEDLIGKLLSRFKQAEDKGKDKKTATTSG